LLFKSRVARTTYTIEPRGH